jgi:hypothetical protein
MKAGALWGRISCGGLATRLPGVGVPSNRWCTADFRGCCGLIIRPRDAAASLPVLEALPATFRRRIANPPQVINLPHKRSSHCVSPKTVKHPARARRKRRRYPGEVNLEG